MNINPGMFKKTIQFVTSKDGVDSSGFPIASEVVVRTCNAQVTQKSGTEVSRSNAEFSEVNVRFLVRYTPTVLTNDMKILFDGDRYDIDYINDYGFSHQYVEVFAKKQELV